MGIAPPVRKRYEGAEAGLRPASEFLREALGGGLSAEPEAKPEPGVSAVLPEGRASLKLGGRACALKARTTGPGRARRRTGRTPRGIPRARPQGGCMRPGLYTGMASGRLRAPSGEMRPE